MRWPWQGREVRQDSSYTDTLVQLIVSNARGENVPTTATAALEAAAGVMGRAFAGAEVQAPDAVAAGLTPECLALVGRQLVRRGELVFLIRVGREGLQLLPAQSHDVWGGPDPMGWQYRLTISGPDAIETHTVPATAVVHLRYAVEPETPWRGVGPLQVAATAGRLSAETAQALADETSGPRGSFLPVPVDGDDPTLAQLKADIKAAAGKVLTVQGGDWDNAGGGARADWQQRRMGADPPAALVELYRQTFTEIGAACGVPAALWLERGDGTARREAYRQLLVGTVQPVGRLVARELSAKLDAPVAFDWVELRAADVAGRARAFQSMVGGGMDVAQAAALSGLVVPE